MSAFVPRIYRSCRLDHLSADSGGRKRLALLDLALDNITLPDARVAGREDCDTASLEITLPSDVGDDSSLYRSCSGAERKGGGGDIPRLRANRLRKAKAVRVEFSVRWRKASKAAFRIKWTTG